MTRFIKGDKIKPLVVLEEDMVEQELDGMAAITIPKNKYPNLCEHLYVSFGGMILTRQLGDQDGESGMYGVTYHYPYSQEEGEPSNKMLTYSVSYTIMNGDEDGYYLCLPAITTTFVTDSTDEHLSNIELSRAVTYEGYEVSEDIRNNFKQNMDISGGADWNVNDNKQPGYIKNRTHYDENVYYLNDEYNKQMGEVFVEIPIYSGIEEDTFCIEYDLADNYGLADDITPKMKNKIQFKYNNGNEILYDYTIDNDGQTGDSDIRIKCTDSGIQLNMFTAGLGFTGYCKLYKVGQVKQLDAMYIPNIQPESSNVIHPYVLWYGCKVPEEIYDAKNDRLKGMIGNRVYPYVFFTEPDTAGYEPQYFYPIVVLWDPMDEVYKYCTKHVVNSWDVTTTPGFYIKNGIVTRSAHDGGNSYQS